MADTKISAMTSAPTLANADQLPAVQGGANVRVSKSVILTASPAEDITLQGVAGQNVLLRNFGGGLVVSVLPTDVLDVQALAGYNLGMPGFFSSLVMTAAGAVTLTSHPGQVLKLDAGGGGVTLTLDITTGKAVFTAPAGVVVPYTDLTGGAWTIPAPVDHDAALDRLAIAIRAMGWAGAL